MKILALIKQVPATDKVKMDEETGTMIRDGVEAELNPLDLYAVEEAVRIKENLGNDAEISVISMGPQIAVDAVKNAIAMGCDKGYLLSGKKFAGADTWATGYALSIAIKKMLAEFDLILCGERATDGETGQVGPGVGAHLGIPVLTYVSKIAEISKEKIIVHRAIEGGYEVVEAPIPVLMSVVKEINEPRLPSLMQILGAANKPINEWSADSLTSKLDPKVEAVELKGVPMERKNIVYKDDIEESISKLVDSLAKEGVLR